MSACFALLAVLCLAATANASTFTPNTFDDGPSDGVCDEASPDGCTLRDAISAANDSPDADTVQLAAGTYSIDGRGDNYNNRGDLDVSANSGDLTITGGDSRTTVIDGGGNDRVLDIAAADLLPVEGPDTFSAEQPVGVTVNGVTVRNGFTGGAICDFEVGSSLDQARAVVQYGGGYDFDYSGGGLRIGYGANVTLNDSAVSYNRAGSPTPFDSGNLLELLTNFGIGGGIANAGELTLNRTTVHRNITGLVGGGIANSGILHVNQSTISQNVVSIAGGGVLNTGPMDVNQSEFSGNMSGIAGGGLVNVTPESSGGDVVPLFSGVEPPAADVPNSVVNTTFDDNLSRLVVGGGILTAGALDLTNDTIANNEEASTLLGRLVGPGAESSFLGFLGSGGRGGGLYVLGGPTQVKNTILASNIDDGRASDCWDESDGGLVSLGNNIVGSDAYPDNGCYWNTPENDGQAPFDQVNVDPKLDSPHENGGPTRTMALLDGSPALDAAADCPAVDQRGGHRPPAPGSAGSACDIGAYEAYSLGDLSVAANVAGADPAFVGEGLTYTLVVTNDGPDTIRGAKVSDTLPAGVDLQSASAGCAAAAGGVVCDLGDLARNQVKVVKVAVTPTTTGVKTDTATIAAAGMTDTNADNDSSTVQSGVIARPSAPLAPGDQNVLGFRSLNLIFSAPKTISVDTFLHGFNVNADCEGDPCERNIREHAAINTGAARIAGYNLTVTRVHLGAAKKGKVKLRPCTSGTRSGKVHKRCMSNLSHMARAFAPFKVKVVVAAYNKTTGKRKFAKRFIRVTK